MEKIMKFISKEIKKNGLNRNFHPEIRRMIDTSLIDDRMSLNAAFTTFLLKHSKQFPVFESILRKNYLFDLSFLVEQSVDVEKIKKVFGDRTEYIYSENAENEIFVGIKFSCKIYEPMKNISIREYLIPYYLIGKIVKLSEIKFNELVFSDEIKYEPIREDLRKKRIDIPRHIPVDAHKYFMELVQHLKTLNLPLEIVDYELLDPFTNISNHYMGYIFLEETAQWPDDYEARNYAKVAFYCFMFNRSQFKCHISKDSISFKYKNVFFTLKIMLKSDCGVKYRVSLKIQRIISKDESLQRKIRMVKSLLSYYGFYPSIFSDFMVDAISISVRNVIGDAKFIDMFLELIFDTSINTSIIDLDSLKLTSSKIDGNPIKQSHHIIDIFTDGEKFRLNLPKRELIDELRLVIGVLKKSPIQSPCDVELENISSNSSSELKAQNNDKPCDADCSLLDKTMNYNSTSKCYSNTDSDNIGGLTNVPQGKDPANFPKNNKISSSDPNFNYVQFDDKCCFKLPPLPDFDSYDFVLSKKEFKGFDEICGMFPSSFLLGVPEYDFLKYKDTTLYYSAYNKMLMVKTEQSFVENMVVLETSFDFIRSKINK